MDILTLIFKVILVVGAVYVVLGLALYAGQRRLIYHPDPLHVLPKAADLYGVDERAIHTSDGERLIAWQTDAAPGRPTLLYFHGNAGTLSGRAERILGFQQAGLGVLMMSYRGYSGSTGRPSEPANHRDARQAYDFLIEQGIPAGRIIVYGESIGTGVATRLAHDVKVGGLILDAPFTSLVDMAQYLYPWFPVDRFVRDRYPVRDLIADIDAPLLVLHGARDATIPVAMGRAVHAAAGEPKQLAVFADGQHSDLFDHGAMQTIVRFIEEQTTRVN